MTLSVSIAIDRRRGFTLIELALVLVVLGLMTGFGLQLFRVNGDLACYQRTQRQLAVIQQRLDSYARANNRYPKPAIMTVGSNSARYGIEGPISYTPDSLDYAKAAPSSIAFVTLTAPVGSEPALPASSKVLIGALPHVTLGLPGDYAADCWGNKYLYAVTNYLTSSHAAGYPAETGRIRIHTGTAAAPVVLTNRAAYAVISPGQNRYGANPLTGQDLAYRACVLNTARLETQNCNISNSIGTADEIFFSAPFNDVAGATNQFDDLIIYSEKYEALADCPTGSAISWASGNCSATLAATLPRNGVIYAVPSTSATHSGTATLTCTNGTLGTSDESCAALAGCAAPSCALNGLPASILGWATVADTNQCTSGCVANGSSVQRAYGANGCDTALCSGGSWFVLGTCSWHDYPEGRCLRNSTIGCFFPHFCYHAS